MARVKSVVGTEDLHDELTGKTGLGAGVDGWEGAEPPPELDEAPEAPDLQVVAAESAAAAIREAKFMEEKVLVMIEEDENPNAPTFVMLGHNGVSQYVERGKPQAVKRKFLYSGLAARAVRFACKFGLDAAGNDVNKLAPSSRNTHRMVLLDDRNREGGMLWFQKVAAALAR